MKDKLEKYVKGETNYTPIMNFMNKDIPIFKEIGKYAYKEIFKGDLPKELKFFEKQS